MVLFMNRNAHNPIKETSLSSASPDADLISVGQDMFWSPVNTQHINKVEVIQECDPMLEFMSKAIY